MIYYEFKNAEVENTRNNEYDTSRLMHFNQLQCRYYMHINQLPVSNSYPVQLWLARCLNLIFESVETSFNVCTSKICDENKCKVETSQDRIIASLVALLTFNDVHAFDKFFPHFFHFIHTYLSSTFYANLHWHYLMASKFPRRARRYTLEMK